MRDQVKVALRNAIKTSLSMLHPLENEYTEPYLVWSRTENGGWQGEYKNQISLSEIVRIHHQSLEQIGADFLKLFRMHYPKYENLVGFPGLGRSNIIHNPAYILGRVLAELWSRHGTFQCSNDAIEAVVQEFEEFVDLPTVKIHYMAVLLNYGMELQEVYFPGDMIIRQLTEKEVSEIYGDPMWPLGLMFNRSLGIHQFVLEGEYEEHKIFEDTETNDSLFESKVRPSLEKAILTLRTFKEGRVGYETVYFKTRKFCPFPLPTLGFGNLYVPPGRYHIAKHEVESLQQHARLIFSPLDSVMELACSRLADAQTRIRAQDRLIDAVIGLEALLLAGLREEDRRGELRYRFSIHYSTFFESQDEKYLAFRIARDLYDLRSTIAHGGMPTGGICRLGDEQMNLDQAAQRASEMLRDVIRRFLSDTNRYPYKDPRFWERGYFNLTR